MKKIPPGQMGTVPLPLQEHPSVIQLIEMVNLDDRVLALILFGSAATEAIFHDIDFCLVAYDFELRSRLYEYLERFSGVGSPPLDISLYHLLPLYIIHEVLTDSIVVCCKDMDALYSICFEIIREWESFRPRYTMILEGCLEKS